MHRKISKHYDGQLCQRFEIKYASHGNKQCLTQRLTFLFAKEIGI